jgi:cyclophilin family peptidyl-prolyl cis-trans isomerase
MNGKYTVFAKITAGMDVVQKITVGDKISSVRVVKG